MIMKRETKVPKSGPVVLAGKDDDEIRIEIWRQ
jgi:hypothetical protein